MRGKWTDIQGKCSTTLEELDHAEKVATRVMRVVGLRDQRPALLAEAADNRLRAFTIPGTASL